MKRVLITGAAGFLGSHLCDRFIREGYKVIGMDNFITGDKKNIRHVKSLSTYQEAASVSDHNFMQQDLYPVH